MLDICKTLFETLNYQGITYCHWKSNSHLDKALAGETDIDILVHDKDKHIFEKVLHELSIKKILSPKEKQFPGLEDFLGFDYQTGDLIHLHVHYRLVLGQRYIKNHHLPIEDIIFQNLIVKNNVHIPRPEVELLLLIIRAHMKVDVLSLVKHGIKDLLSEGYTAFPADIEGELRGLIKECNIEKFKEILAKTKLPISEKLFTQFIDEFSAGNLKSYAILLTQWKFFSDLKDLRRHKGINIYWKYIRFVMRELPVINKFQATKRKLFPENGKIISIVGADGSGKSTLIKDLSTWLSWKMSVKKYYYGIPKTKFIKLMSYAIRGCNKFSMSRTTALIEYFLWIFIAKKRQRISILSQQDSSNGEIVITDRLPLKAFHSMEKPMDGPRLRQASTRVGMFFSKMEKRYYDSILVPDRIFALQVSIEELRRRKSDLDLKLHKEKSEAVNAMKRNEHTVLIDANQPYPDVQLQVKRMIWAIL
jgi:thymidylate kinase